MILKLFIRASLSLLFWFDCNFVHALQNFQIPDENEAVDQTEVMNRFNALWPLAMENFRTGVNFDSSKELEYLVHDMAYRGQSDYLTGRLMEIIEMPAGFCTHDKLFITNALLVALSWSPAGSSINRWIDNTRKQIRDALYGKKYLKARQALAKLSLLYSPRENISFIRPNEIKGIRSEFPTSERPVYNFDSVVSCALERNFKVRSLEIKRDDLLKLAEENKEGDLAVLVQVAKAYSDQDDDDHTLEKLVVLNLRQKTENLVAILSDNDRRFFDLWDAVAFVSDVSTKGTYCELLKVYDETRMSLLAAGRDSDRVAAITSLDGFIRRTLDQIQPSGTLGLGSPGQCEE